ncbi:patatin [Afipia sp. P52-10]|jgi:predicted acylesterase/phospholipase RssA|uniref:patatin-like phospholipase family protein n=1 Tax=Afipia sp. P52-10 TaxID=1429916 RepID=UPI0003DF2E63|nr:patatin-like phospholipase family protein [Afipia sp. P52-10]ETR75441.1 patatin [Afipia sp. P52-10]
MRRIVSILLACTTLVGCATIYNMPVNIPANGSVVEKLNIGLESQGDIDDTAVGLAFSGGGTRAAAFSFGVLEEMNRIPVRGAQGALVDRVGFISGVSGGSVTAAYYGLRMRDALADFRERFLLRNAEESLTTTVSLGTLGRALGGGVNDQTGFTRWLDANLFNGATFGNLIGGKRPMVWINASDIYNRTPFIFSTTAFTAICSDLSAYPLSNAVAASAAVPLAFAPVVVQAFPGTCNDPLPRWVSRARTQRNTSPMLTAYADAIGRYREGAVPFIKLLDGGLVDNYGLSGLTVERESSETPYGPLTAAQAVKLRRLLFLVVDAKTGLTGDWINTVEGPGGLELVKAAIDTTMDASVSASYTAFNRTMTDWQAALIRWRCGLSAAERTRLGVRPGWNCRDLKFFIGRISFSELEPARAAQLEAVPTRFQLPPAQVEEVIAAGRDALRASSVVRGFLAGL